MSDLLKEHDIGCGCWPHVGQREATEAVVQAAHAEYREGLKRVTPRPLLYDDPASVGRLREKIHEVWGWCAPDDNPDDPVCRGGSCERGAEALVAALVAEAK